MQRLLLQAHSVVVLVHQPPLAHAAVVFSFSSVWPGMGGVGLQGASVCAEVMGS